MESPLLLQGIREFLIARGCEIDEVGLLSHLDSLDYLALIIYVEQKFTIKVDTIVFYGKDFSEQESLESLYERLLKSDISPLKGSVT